MLSWEVAHMQPSDFGHEYSAIHLKFVFKKNYVFIICELFAIESIKPATAAKNLHYAKALYLIHYFLDIILNFRRCKFANFPFIARNRNIP